MLISLLHPSRSRIQKSIQTTDKWVNQSGCDVELIVSIDTDDPQTPYYVSTYPEKVIINQNRSAIDAINNAAKVAKGDILIVVSDDTDCPPNWGSKILKAVAGRKDFVLKVDDGIQRWIVTMPVLDRAYYNRFGYIYYPEYLHMFADTEFTHVADVLRKIVKCDLHFPHRHYSVTKGIKDAVTLKADLTWNQGKQLYLRRVRERFGLGVDVMNVSDTGHYKWIKKNL